MADQKYPPVLAAIAEQRDHLKTAEFARTLGRKGHTARNLYYAQGHAWGVRPRRVAGRLLWPISEVARVLQGEARQAEQVAA
ncbi:hypothetical protein [Ferrovum sp.]|uniref:hypothetical protein n=1 Tax=Ferrovum sp. TaxID=2609467 RepID=UPI00260DCF9F|nr:hypothetical protein [Ferrovum sp.]